MKKILVILALTAAATTASAVNPRIVTATGTFFPTSNISYYLAAEGPLVREAKAFCAEFNEKVDKISNINVQVQGDFELKAGDQTEAVTHPHFIFSALVHCRN